MRRSTGSYWRPSSSGGKRPESCFLSFDHSCPARECGAFLSSLQSSNSVILSEVVLRECEAKPQSKDPFAQPLSFLDQEQQNHYAVYAVYDEFRFPREVIIDVTTLQVLFIVLIATLIRSTFGFGEALVAVPLLAFCIPLKVAAPLAVLVSITIAGIVVIQDWKKIHLRSTAWLVLATLFGIPLGLLLLTSNHQRLVKATLGVIILAFSIYSMIGRTPLELETRQSRMAACLWILRRGAGRSLWNEWPTARRLRGHAALVGATLSRNPARIFSARQYYWHGGLLARRIMDSGRNPLLSALTPGHPVRRLPRQGDQSSPARRGFSKISLPRLDRHRNALVGSGINRPALSVQQR